MKGTRTDSNSYIFRDKGPLRVIAFITLWSFLFTSGLGDIFVELAWARKTPLEQSVNTITLPGYLGEINGSFK